jgi:hypothetical protein
LDRLNRNTKKYPDDELLNLYTAQAHGSLNTEHPDNTKKFLVSPGVAHLEHCLKDHKGEPALEDAESKLMHIISDPKNESIPKLGEIGAPKWVTDLLRSARAGNREPAMVDNLNACKNMIIPSRDNAKKYLDQDMDKALVEIIRNPPSKPTGELALEVLKLLLGPADIQRARMLIEKEKAVEAITE